MGGGPHFIISSTKNHLSYNFEKKGGSSGRNRTRTCDLLCVREVLGSSTVSTPYIWWYGIPNIAIFGGISVHYVHLFHRVILALQMVANGLMKVG